MRTALLSTLFLVLCGSAAASDHFLRYQFNFLPEKKAVDVEILVSAGNWLRRAQFDFSGYEISRIDGGGELERKDDILVWRPPTGEAKLSYRVTINNERNSGGFDAYITSQWALLRGEDLIPPVRIRKAKGAEVAVTMHIELPKSWSSANSGWPREDDGSFRIDNPNFTFPRPAGWIVAGVLGTRHEQLGDTQISISAPQGHNFRQMEMLSFVGMLWPHLAAAVQTDAKKILITGAGEPMWRGGLSGPNSLYVHSDRPLVSENGTSTLIHELFHVIGGIDSASNHDWIVEGLAEFYSVEIIYRAGGYTEQRRKEVFAGLEAWSSKVQSLLAKHSKGEVTARAAVLFEHLNREIIEVSDGKLCLDHLLRRVQHKRGLQPSDLRDAFRALVDQESQVLRSPLLNVQQK